MEVKTRVQGTNLAAASPGDIIAGKYEVEGVLGSGGMGVVCSVRHIELGRRFAVKVLSSEALQNREIAERFTREARAAVKLRGEHVVSVVDVGKLDDGSPFMVMEHLEGHDLREEIESRGPLPIVEAVDYVLQACEALAEAHAAGIVHRDVKPPNLFLTRRPDDSPLVKVVDFGISKVALSDGPEEVGLTATRTLLGSPQYMAPEQIRSARSVDHRTDIWGLGVTLYELVTGEMPFEGDTVAAVSAAIAADPPVPLRLRCPDAPAKLESIVFRCLEKDRERRFQHIGELVDALMEFAPEHSLLSARRAVRISGQSGSRFPVARKSLSEADTAIGSSGNVNAEAETLAATAATARESSRLRKPWVYGLGLAAVLLLVGGIILARGTQRSASVQPSANPGIQAAAPVPRPEPSARTQAAASAAEPVVVPEEPAPEPSATASAVRHAPPPVRHVRGRPVKATTRSKPKPRPPSPVAPTATHAPRYDPLSDRK